MKLLIFSALFVLFANSLCAEQKDQKKKFTNPFKNVLGKKEKQKIGKLALAAQKMRIEGEGRRHTQDISGSVKVQLTQCSICDLDFKVWDVKSQSLNRGMDRDFCKHAKFKSGYDYDIWCCPRCGYAAHKSVFKQEFSDEFKNEALEKNLPVFQNLFNQNLKVNISKFEFTLDQKDIPTVIKYQMMELYEDKLNLDHYQKSVFYLRHAWIERKRLISSISNHLLSNSLGLLNTKLNQYKVRNQIDKIFPEPSKLMDFIAQTQAKTSARHKEDHFILKIYKAGALDRLGYPKAALKELSEAAEMPLPQSIKEIAKTRLTFLMNEFKYLKQSIVELRKALVSKQIEVDHQPEHIYLVGEIYRRLGLYAEAKLWFESARDITPNKSQLAKWSREQISLLPKIKSDLFNASIQSERLLANEVQKQFRDDLELKNFNDKKYNERLSNFTLWLDDLRKSTDKYYTEFDSYPENVELLVDLGLLKHKPELESKAKQNFHLLINPNREINQINYMITSKLPFVDSKGKFWLAINSRNTIKRLRRQPIFKEIP